MAQRYKDWVNSWMDLDVVSKPRRGCLVKAWKDHEDKSLGRIEIANML